MSQEHQINKTARLIRALILLVAVAGISSWAWKNFGPKTTPIAASNQDNSSEHTIVVTYFTSNARCKTCLKIERLTNETINKNFNKELASKAIVFQTINFDKPENKHYIKDYGLAFKTVIVSAQKNGKEVQWDKYDKVWTLVDTPEKFSAYLDDGIRQHLPTKK